MRLLFFSPYYLPYVSGLTTYPATLFEALGAEHEIRVLCFAHQPGLPARERLAGHEVIRLPHWFRLSKGFIAPGSVSAFRQHLGWAERVMLNLPSVEGLPMVWMARRRRIPVLALLHCQIDLGPGLARQTLSGVVNAVVERQLALSDRIVGYTRSYLDSVGVSARHGDKLTIVPPPVRELPVDGAQLAEYRSIGGPDAIRIGFAGRMAREKGIEVLLEALAGLAPDLRRRITVLLAGPAPAQVVGESNYGHSMLRRLAACGLAHRHLGTLRDGDLGAFYHALHLLVLPSVNRTEAFGMVQIEAMRAGTPVIVSGLPGVREPVERTGMGLIVPPGDAGALRDAVEHLICARDDYTGLDRRERLAAIYDPRQAVAVYRQWLSNAR